MDGNDSLVQVNYLAPFYLTNLLIPLLLKTPKSRVVNVSCDRHNDQIFPFTMDLNDLNIENRKFQWWYNYCETKLYNVMFTKSLKDFLTKIRTQADVYRYHSVKVVTVDPGLARTGLIKKSPKIAKNIFYL